MSTILNMLKTTKNKFNLGNHPIAKEEIQVKKGYLDGVALLTNVDEEIHEDEKGYLASLIEAFDMAQPLLDDLIKFAKTPDADKFNDIMSRLKVQDDVKVNFMVDVLLLANKDKTVHENETELIEQYFEILSFTSEVKNKVLDIVHVIEAKSEEDAISFFLADKDFYAKFAYLFEFIGIDAEKLANNIYSFEWVDWTFEYGGVENDNQVARNPITNKQFSIYLNSLQKLNLLKVGNVTTQFIKDSLLIFDTENSAISFENDKFVYSKEDENQFVTGIAVDGVKGFMEWLNNFLDTIAIDSLSLYGEDRSNDIMMKETCIGKTTLNELFWANNLSSYRFFCSGNFGSSTNNYTRTANVESNKPTKDLTFRLMKVVKTED